MRGRPKVRRRLAALLAPLVVLPLLMTAAPGEAAPAHPAGGWLVASTDTVGAGATIEIGGYVEAPRPERGLGQLVPIGGGPALMLGETTIHSDGTFRLRHRLHEDFERARYWPELRLPDRTIRGSIAVRVVSPSLLAIRAEPSAVVPGGDVRLHGGPFGMATPMAFAYLRDGSGLDRLAILGNVPTRPNLRFDQVLRIPPTVAPGDYEIFLEAPEVPGLPGSPEAPLDHPATIGPIEGAPPEEQPTGGDSAPPPGPMPGPASAAAATAVGEPGTSSGESTPSADPAGAPDGQQASNEAPVGPGEDGATANVAPGSQPGGPGSPPRADDRHRSRSVPVTVLARPAARIAVPHLVERGRPMTVALEHFTPGDTARVELVQDSATHVALTAGEFAIGSDGRATATFNVPTTARRGAYWVRAIDRSGLIGGSDTHTYVSVPTDAPILADPGRVAEGGTVMVSADGIRGDYMAVDLLGETTTNSLARESVGHQDGRVATLFRLPAEIGPGRYRFRIASTVGEVVTSEILTVEPEMSLSLTHTGGDVRQGGRFVIRVGGVRKRPLPGELGSGVEAMLIDRHRPHVTYAHLVLPREGPSPAEPLGRGPAVRPDGTVDTDAFVPGWIRPGSYALRVRVGSLERVLPDPVRVVPGQAWDVVVPDSVAAGATLSLRGSGLGPREDLSLEFADLVDETGRRLVAPLGVSARQRSGLLVADSGEFFGDLAVPAAVPSGLYRLALRDLRGHAAFTMTDPIVRVVNDAAGWHVRLDRDTAPQGGTFVVAFDGAPPRGGHVVDLVGIPSTGRVVQRWTVGSGTAIARLRVSSAVSPGTYELHVVPGFDGQPRRVATFNVVVGVPLLVSATPGRVRQGESLTVEGSGYGPSVTSVFVRLDGLRSENLGRLPVERGAFHGSFRVPFGARAGTYTLLLSPNAEPEAAAGTVEVVPGDGPVVTFEPPVVPQGSDLSVAIERVRFDNPLARFVSVSLIDPVTGGGVGSMINLEVRDGRARGTLEVPGTVPPGRYRLSAASAEAGADVIVAESDGGFRSTVSRSEIHAGETLRVEAGGFSRSLNSVPVDLLDSAGDLVTALGDLPVVGTRIAGDLVIPRTAPLGEARLRFRLAGLEDGPSFRVIATPPPTGDDPTPPTATVGLAPQSPSPASGWHRRPPVVAVAASDEGGSGVAGLVYRATGADAVPSVRTVVDRAQLTIPTDGITTVHVHAVDRRGNAGPEASTTVKVDQTPPVIEVTSPPTANRYLAVTEVGVALRFGATDPLSGLEYLDARLFEWEGGGGIVRDGHVIDAPGIYRLDILARDRVGNVSGFETTLVVVDPQGTSIAGKVAFEHPYFGPRDGSKSGNVEVRMNLKQMRGASRPFGQIEIDLKAFGAVVRPHRVDWLVVHDGRATLQARLGRRGKVLISFKKGSGGRHDFIRLQMITPFFRADTGNWHGPEASPETIVRSGAFGLPGGPVPAPEFSEPPPDYEEPQEVPLFPT